MSRPADRPLEVGEVVEEYARGGWAKVRVVARWVTNRSPHIVLVGLRDRSTTMRIAKERDVLRECRNTKSGLYRRCS